MLLSTFLVRLHDQNGKDGTDKQAVVLIDGKLIRDLEEANNEEGWIDIIDTNYYASLPSTNGVVEGRVDTSEKSIPEPAGRVTKRIYGKVDFGIVSSSQRQICLTK